MKSFGRKFGVQKRQPLNAKFRGAEHLGAYYGHGPKGIGAVCDPSTFSGVLEVPAGVLGPRNGAVLVDLVEPGCDPVPFEFGDVVQRKTFSDMAPSVVIRIVQS
jgi:hypothetical protein